MRPTDNFPREIAIIVFHLTVMFAIHVPGMLAASIYLNDSNETNVDSWLFIQIITQIDTGLNIVVVVCGLVQFVKGTKYVQSAIVLTYLALICNYIVKAIAIPIGVWLWIVASGEALYFLGFYNLINVIYVSRGTKILLSYIND